MRQLMLVLVALAMFQGLGMAGEIKFVDPNSVVIDGEPYYLAGVDTSGLNITSEAAIMNWIDAEIHPNSYMIVDDEIILRENGTIVNHRIETMCDKHRHTLA